MTERDKAKKEALEDFRRAKTVEERAQAFTNYLKKYVQPINQERARTINPYKSSKNELLAIFDGELV